MKKIKKLTKKLKLVESSKSSNASKVEKSLKVVKTKKTKKQKNPTKKRVLIIESTSSSQPKTLLKEEEKNEIKLINNGDNKTYLKISTDLNKMSPSHIELTSGRLNEKFSDLMGKLADIMLKQGETFRARAYQKAQETIMSYPGDIMSANDLKGKPNIGPTIMEKLNEYSQTGTLKVIEREKNNPVNILGDIYGVGPKKAKELVEGGITSIAQLRENQDKLNDIQKVGLKYYEDILKRIPRSEIQQYAHIFETEFNKVSTPDSQFEIVGSYRRGAKESGDIDVIITADSPKVFVDFINSLITQKIIVEVLSRGPTKCLVIAKIPSSDSARRVDFLYSSPEEYPFSVLYFTGSKIFNTVMRGRALNMGLTMNEHGLYKMENKKKGEKVSHIFKTEKDIFDYLNLEYKAPEERIDGRAVIIKGQQPPSIKLDVPDEPEVLVKEPVVEVPIHINSSPNAKTKTKREKKGVKGEKGKGEKPKLIIEDDLEIPHVVDANVKLIVLDFKKNGIGVLEKLNENQLSSILREANKAYYNEEPLMTDNEYDIVKEYIENKYPSNKAIFEVGAPITKNKVKLPYEMASMDKIKPDTGALTNWMKKYSGPYVMSCKLDGVSGLYTTEGAQPKLYTRGDGKVGQDISHLIPHLRLPKSKNIVIRGEFIIPKATFETKYKSKFANPRNMVAGLINHKTINEAISDINFVAYEVIKPIKNPSEQMEFLGTLDVERVLFETSSCISNEILSQLLVAARKTYIFEIDGIIVTNDKLYPREHGNPEHAFAFKMVLSDQIAEAKVVDVIWTPSKDGYLKPRVQIEPINLGGVKIEYATGFNGSFINDNKVGVGAIIELIRSGDVIPHIRKVVVPATQSKMPSVPFKWNDTHIDVLLEDIDTDQTVKEKNITGFFKGIGVDGLSTGNVARIVQSGYDTVPKILKMTVENLLKVEGFREKTATKIHDGIKEKMAVASLVTIMSSSNVFGRGFSDKKLEIIIDSYPNVLLSSESVSDKVKKIAAMKGMATKTAEAFVEKIPNFIQFIKESGLDNKLNQAVTKKTPVDESHPLFGKTIVMTGFRDNSIQDALKSVGSKLGSSVSKNTFIVLVKDKEDDTGKAAEARKLGVPLMSPEEFRQKYLI
jgi:NAD-dependent DNA ligase